MPQSLTEMAKDLVEELVKNNLIEPEDMQHQLHQIHASLLDLKTREDRTLSNGMDKEGERSGIPQAKDWKKSIRKHAVECLVCGQTFKQLSARHLSQHDLNPRTYRERFGIPSNQPLSAKATTAMRRRVVQETRPWEKAPAYIEAHKPTPAPPKRTRKKAASTSQA